MARLAFECRDREGYQVRFETSEKEGSDLMASYEASRQWLLDHGFTLVKAGEKAIAVSKAPGAKNGTKSRFDGQHCPKCGVTLSGQEKFCGYCGVNLEEQSPPQPAEGEKPPLANKPFCIACGKSFEPDDQFCDICGAALLRTIEVPASDTQPILRTVTTIEAVQPAAIPPPATPYLPVAAQAQPASPTTRPVQRIIPTKVPPKNATVHLFRDDYDLYKIKVWIDGDFYTKVSDHKDIMILLPAGKHTFFAKRLKTSSELLTIDLSPGQEIYLIFSWQIKDNISIPVIELLLDSAPRPQLSKRRLSLGCSFTLLIIGGLIAIPILTIIAYIAITGEAVGWVILEELLGH